MERAEADPRHRRAQPGQLRRGVLGVLQRPRRLRGYRSINGSQEFVDTETNGIWATAELVPGFRNGPSDLEYGWAPEGPWISCPAPGNCTFASSDTSATNTAVTSVATETNGLWGDAAPLPGFAAAGGAVTSLSCPAVGDCSAGGWTYSGTDSVPFVASETGGTWATARPVVGFTGGGGGPSVSCAAPGVCAAGGSDHGYTEIWVLARSSAATTLTTVASSAAKLTYGKETAEKITVTVKATTPTPAGKVTVTANGKASTALFLGLGAIALLVGGIGIANVMAIAVLERRPEIGLRRALGAARIHIAAQFLTEAVLLGTLGGVVGLTAGTVITVALPWPACTPLSVPPVCPRPRLSAPPERRPARGSAVTVQPGGLFVSIPVRRS